ncbi:hypothetical protein MHK_006557 [Candidatus Magnetomorum sp. HK-1]|nr:hypothetical protein MHK_006557 [Candidatus Magnetomorum sp. HK-1]
MENIEGIEIHIQKELNDNSETKILEWDVVKRFIDAETDNFIGDIMINEDDYQNELTFSNNDLTLILEGKEKKYIKYENSYYEGLIYNYSQCSFIWEKFFIQTVKNGLSYFSLYCLYKCSWLLTKKEFYINEDDYYEDVEVLSDDLFDKIRDKLLQDKQFLYRFKSIKNYIENLDLTNEPKQFCNIVDFLKNNLQEISDEENGVNNTFNSKDKIVEVNSENENVVIEAQCTIPIKHSNDNELRDLNKTISKEISFLNYIFPSFLIQFCKIFEAKKYDEADSYLQGISRSNKYPEPLIYYRFLIKLLRLQCFFEKDKMQLNSLSKADKSKKNESNKSDLEKVLEQNIHPMILSLWLDVVTPIKSDNKNEFFEFGKNYPALYSKLIELTLQYLLLVDSDTIKIDETILTKELLRMHLAITMWN